MHDSLTVSCCDTVQARVLSGRVRHGKWSHKRTDTQVIAYTTNRHADSPRAIQLGLNNHDLLIGSSCNAVRGYAHQHMSQCVEGSQQTLSNHVQVIAYTTNRHANRLTPVQLGASVHDLHSVGGC